MKEPPPQRGLFGALFSSSQFAETLSASSFLKTQSQDGISLLGYRIRVKAKQRVVSILSHIKGIGLAFIDQIRISYNLKIVINPFYATQKLGSVIYVLNGTAPNAIMLINDVVHICLHLEIK